MFDVFQLDHNREFSSHSLLSFIHSCLHKSSRSPETHTTHGIQQTHTQSSRPPFPEMRRSLPDCYHLRMLPWPRPWTRRDLTILNSPFPKVSLLTIPMRQPFFTILTTPVVMGLLLEEPPCLVQVRQNSKAVEAILRPSHRRCPFALSLSRHWTLEMWVSGKSLIQASMMGMTVRPYRQTGRR